MNNTISTNHSATVKHLHVTLNRVLLATFLTAFAAVITSVMAATVMVDVAPGGDLSFSPASVSIQPGDTVQWNWTDSGMGHSVSSGSNGIKNGLFDSGVVKSNTFIFSHTFTSAGTFPYFCQPHFDDGMTGMVTVAAAATPQLTNISTRLRVLTGSNLLIGGFIVTGTDNKKLVLRALGPTLSNFGIADALQDPIIELHDVGGALIVSNDNWKDTQQAEISATGLAPPNDLESAILHTFAPGSYTAIVRGKGATTGTALVEAYDVDQMVNAHLTNISTRGFVDVDNAVMIAGFVVSAGGSVNVVMRALGPTLTQFGVANALQDPTLALFDANGTLVYSNNNWKDSQQAAIQATGLAPPDDRESAIQRTLTPGNYTIIERGNNNTTGVGLIEVYKIP